jgi:hypothetical protein
MAASFYTERRFELSWSPQSGNPIRQPDPARGAEKLWRATGTKIQIAFGKK